MCRTDSANPTADPAPRKLLDNPNVPSRYPECPQAWVDVWGTPALAFVVPGAPVGYVAAPSPVRSARKNRAWRYASDVRIELMGQLARTPCTAPYIVIVGEPGHPGARLTATKATPLHIGTTAYFVNGTHPDPENVHKLAKDALFWKVKGGDKWTGGIYLPPRYSRTDPRTEVFVWPHIDGTAIFDREVAA